MKRMIVIATTGAIALAGTLANSAITGSKHDFQGDGWAHGEICLPCHAPHRNLNTVPGQVLWNHAPSSVAADAYTFYSSGTMNSGKPTFMSDISRNCMSCHDGTTALDAFGSEAGTGMKINDRYDSRYNLTTDISRDHPISIDYTPDVIAADGHLADLDAPSGITAEGTVATDMLFGRKVECSSCHDVHNTYNVPRLLKKSNEGSALCLTCHLK